MEAPEKTIVHAAAPPAEEEPEQEPAEQEPAAKRNTFNPMEHALVPEEGPSALNLVESDERTQMFSPMDVLDAGKVMKNRELSQVPTKEIVVDRKAPAKPEGNAPEGESPSQLLMEETSEADKTKWKNLKVEGERTQVFAPVEAVKAAADSRRPSTGTPRAQG